MRFLKNYSDREVFFISLVLVFSGYILSDWIDSKRFFIVESRLDRVEVTLDKVVNRINEDVILNDKIQENKIESTKVFNETFDSLSHSNKKISLNNKEFDCLARNVYWEALREPLIGQIGVAHITYNRVKSGKWGKSFCQVVFSPKQFSWTNNKNIRDARPKNEKQWYRAKHSARLFLNGTRVNTLDTSQFYFAQYIKTPHWAKSMAKDTQIGQHIFYTALR